MLIIIGLLSNYIVFTSNMQLIYIITFFETEIEPVVLLLSRFVHGFVHGFVHEMSWWLADYDDLTIASYQN